MKSMVLISPSFFSIEKNIIEEFESRNINVTFFDERMNNNKLNKIILRLNSNILKRKIDRYYKEILQKVDFTKVDLLLVIKAESMPIWFVDKISKEYPNVVSMHYMYDPIGNYPRIYSKIDSFDYALSFDKQDCEKYQWHLLPLFYPPEYQLYPATEKTDLSNIKGAFIGTLHSDRAKVMANIENALPNEVRNNLFIYYYIPMKAMFYKGKYITGEYSLLSSSQIYTTPLAFKETLMKLRRADFIIDLHHDKQTGLTLRTMEAIGLGKKLITTNPHIKTYDFYHCDNILVVDKKKPVIPQEWLLKPYVKLDDDVYEKYSLKGFVDELIRVTKEIKELKA